MKGTTLYLVTWTSMEYESLVDVCKHLFECYDDAQAKFNEYKEKIPAEGWFGLHEQGDDYRVIETEHSVDFFDHDMNHDEYVSIEAITVE